MNNDRCCPVTVYVASFPSFMSKGKYENAIEISFIEYYVVLSYCYTSIYLFSFILCSVLRIAHYSIVICLDKRISILLSVTQ